MKSFYKLKSALLVMSSFCLVSCDGENPDNSSSSDISPSDITVSAGELFTFENILNPDAEQVLDTLRVTSDNLAVVGDVNYDYSKTGEFNATLVADVPVEEALEEAVSQIFSTNNASNTEVRSLLLVPDASADAPVLTTAELTRLLELLNVNGAGVSINPEDPDQVVVTPSRVYTFTYTSTLADRAAGLAAGRYSLEARSQVMGYTITTLTDDEGNNFQYYLPSLTSDFLDIETFEQGTFTLQLNNSVGF